MKIIRIITFALCGLLMTSFITKEDSSSEELCQTWTYSKYKDGCEIFVKSRNFKKNKRGISFNKNGSLKKRQNAGWCGTPPVSYKNFNGSWQLTSENTLTMNYEFWGGDISEEWEIVEVKKNSLKVRVKSSNITAR